MRIAYVTPYDARKITSWSGTAYHIGKALEDAGAHVDWVSLSPGKESLPFWLKRNYYQRILRQKYTGDYDPRKLARLNRETREALDRLNPDIVLTPQPYSFDPRDLGKPCAFWGDCTFASMVGFYEDYVNLNKGNMARGQATYQRLYDHASLVMVTSDWAAQSVRQDYQTDPGKVHVVPFGANIDCDRTAESVAEVARARPRDCCRLLFIGQKWERKRGDFAVQVARELEALGQKVELSLVGNLPENLDALPAFAKPIGFIRKAEPDGLEQFNRTFAESHFLLLPSTAEAFGIVFCEASSFGVPSVATDVGGVSSVVREGINGKTFPLPAEPAEWAAWIAAQMNDYDRYLDLSATSFREFESRLNWKIAGRTALDLMEKALVS